MAEIDDLKPGDEPTGGPPPRRQSLGFVIRWETLLLVLLGGTIAFGASVSTYFLQSTNLFYICLNVGEVAIMALPLTLIVITGEIDLSVASMLGLSGVLMAELFKHGWPIWPAMLAAIVVGDGARRVQRLPRHARRAAVAGGDDRDADALPRHRAGDPPDGHDRRLPGPPHEHRRHPDPRHAHPVLDRVLRSAGDRLRRRAPRDAARPRDLRHRRGPGGGVLRGHPRQADQVLALRPLRDAVRVRRRALDAPLRLGPLRLRDRARAVRRHDRPARRRLDLRRPRHDPRSGHRRGRPRHAADGVDGRPHARAGSEHRRRRAPPRERDRPERSRHLPARPRAAAERGGAQAPNRAAQADGP